MRPLKPALLLPVVLALSLSLGAQSRLERVMAEAAKESELEQNLRALTDEIGGRVPGTPAMEKAVQWAEAAFHAAGADSVERHAFPMPQSWEEGETRVEITAPVQFRVNAKSLAWAPAIPKPLEARVVGVGMGRADDFAKAGDLGGAVALVHSELLRTWDDLFLEYMRAPAIIQAAREGKAAAIAFISTREHELLYEHINPGATDGVPSVLLSREDALRIARLLADKQPVRMRLHVPNRIGKPFTTHNVVAELRGSEQPDEFVILGAHLDSWAMGTGALDNGANCALVVDALRAIKDSGLKPRRSIRFVLYSGEEQGMQGSRAHADSLGVELEKLAAVVIFDAGTGRVTGFSLGGRRDVAATLPDLIAPLRREGELELTTDAFVGTDNLDYLLHGVPTLVANQEPSNYLVNYHANSDTYDKVDLRNLRRHVVLAAGIAFAIADAPQRVGRRQSRADIEQLMRDTGLDEQLRVFGIASDWQSGARGRKP